ncbi:M16 family metallopeptidase [Janibacter cremeus]|uniref:Putative Zn-dependent peptidase n=1 Tax=Janibacter cremeus TaxID=1285192 RepID=A0A852VK21_9MICO|nr:pitrilysin family protein [Janibacter cremeus]NYF97457.1 putative Zn-dependent peptidase [Janibacter cremeus]
MSTPTVPRPQVTAPGEWSFPQPRELTLPNGIGALVHDVPGQYVISVRLTVPVALRHEPGSKEGVAWVMARLLDEGTRTHGQRELSELLERRGIALGAGMSEASLGVDLDVPQRFLGQALELLTECVSEPVFEQTEVSRIVRTRLAEIEQERASAGRRAFKEWARTYYDPTIRASRPGGGQAETVADVTRQDVVDFHAAHVHPEGTTVVVAGDLTGIDVEELLGSTLGAWTTSGRARPVDREPAPRAADAARVVLVDRPGSVQSEILIGAPGPDRRVESGWAPFPVLAYVMGGAPNARIDQVLREEKGYTYGIRSGFRPRQVGSAFTVAGSVRADSTVDSLRLLEEILAGAQEGFTEEETRAGVDFMTLTAPGRYDTADAIADETAGLAGDELPLTFTSDTIAAMRRLTADDLSRAWREQVTHEWTVVVVGDASLYKDEVTELGLGPVTVVPN